MKIGISINEVLRNFLGQFAYTYEKYVGDIDIKEEDVTNFNLIEFYKFENVNRLNSFLYSEASLEVFGHAGLMSDGLMNHFNNFLMDMKDDGEHEIELVSREVNRSIPSTFSSYLRLVLKHLMLDLLQTMLINGMVLMY